MSLSKTQQDFTYDIMKLIEYAYSTGYQLTFGDAYRSPKAFGNQGQKGPYGRDRSAHKYRLAVDFNLFQDGLYLTGSNDYKPLGEYWKTLAEDNVWGGDFLDKNGKSRDGNHFSKRYRGIA